MFQPNDYTKTKGKQTQSHLTSVAAQNGNFLDKFGKAGKSKNSLKKRYVNLPCGGMYIGYYILVVGLYQPVLSFNCIFTCEALSLKATGHSGTKKTWSVIKHSWKTAENHRCWRYCLHTPQRRFLRYSLLRWLSHGGLWAFDTTMVVEDRCGKCAMNIWPRVFGMTRRTHYNLAILSRWPTFNLLRILSHLLYKYVQIISKSYQVYTLYVILLLLEWWQQAPDDRHFGWKKTVTGIGVFCRTSQWIFHIGPPQLSEVSRKLTYSAILAVLHSWRLTWNIIPWRFGRLVSFLNMSDL